MPTITLNKNQFEENSKIYKAFKDYYINMIPSDPNGSLDESFFLLNLNWSDT